MSCPQSCSTSSVVVLSSNSAWKDLFSFHAFVISLSVLIDLSWWCCNSHRPNTWLYEDGFMVWDPRNYLYFVEEKGQNTWLSFSYSGGFCYHLIKIQVFNNGQQLVGNWAVWCIWDNIFFLPVNVGQVEIASKPKMCSSVSRYAVYDGLHFPHLKLLLILPFPIKKLNSNIEEDMMCRLQPFDPKKRYPGKAKKEMCVSSFTTYPNFLHGPKHFIAFLKEKKKFLFPCLP